MKHRSKEEIAALVLGAIVNTHRPTQTMIMYRAYLTHVQLKQLLVSSMEKGLIEYHKLERIYTIREIANKQYKDWYNSRIPNHGIHTSSKRTIQLSCCI